MTLEQWQRGWDALVLEAKLRGSFVGLLTNNLAVPRDLWDRMVAYPPKPISLPKDGANMSERRGSRHAHGMTGVAPLEVAVFRHQQTAHGLDGEPESRPASLTQPKSGVA